ncbi:MAG: zinc ribbon domain-containing protein [Candidatus Dormibacteria bacterium]
MPIYEYGCPGCRRKRSIFWRSMSAVEVDPACPQCGRRGLVKLVSRVSVPKGEDARLDDLAYGGTFGDLDENDPNSVARWAGKMAGHLGDDDGNFQALADEAAGGDAGPGAVEDWTPGS